MAKNFFKRYIWLIDTVNRRGPIPFEEISRQWEMSAINDEGGPLPERTFHNHRLAIEDMFGIEIKCDRAAGYYIANSDDLEGEGLRAWLLESMSLNNLLSESRELRDRILFEEIPSSQKWLPLFLEAIQGSNAVEISYQSYRSGKCSTFTIWPYCLKLFRKRWYVLARSVATEDLRIYSLDKRMQNAEVLKERFRLPAKFSAEKYFNKLFGVIATGNEPEIVRIKIPADQVGYYESLPLHFTQKKVSATDEYTVFEYYLAPTYDFKQELLGKGSLLEVLEPLWLRDFMIEEIGKMNALYD